MRCNSNCAVLVSIGASVCIMCVGVGIGANICPKNAVLFPILVIKIVKNRRNLRFLVKNMLFKGFFVLILLEFSLFLVVFYKNHIV